LNKKIYSERQTIWNGKGGRMTNIKMIFSALAVLAAAHVFSMDWIGSYPGMCLHMALSGQYAYCTDTAGVQVIDISNPAALSRVRGYALTGNGFLTGRPTGIAASGGNIYVAGDSSLIIINDGDFPDSITIRKRTIQDKALSIAVSGRYAYVAGTAAFFIINLDSLMSPGFVTGSCAILDGTKSLTVAGDFAYAAGTRGLQMIAIDSSASPAAVGTYVGSYSGVAVSGTYAYVTGSGLTVIDVRDPSRASFGASVPNLISSGIVISGGLAWLDGPKAVDISNPRTPVPAGQYTLPYGGNIMAVSGGTAFLAFSSLAEPGLCALNTVDVTDLTTPAVIGRYETPPYTVFTGTVDSWSDNDYWSPAFYAYLSGSQGFKILDVTSPASPQLCSEYCAWGCVDIAADWGYVYAVGQGGLRIFDVRNPRTPVFLGSWNTGGYVRRVMVELLPDNPFGKLYALVLELSGGLRIINVRDRTNPQLAGSIDLAGFSLDLTISDGYAYVIGRDGRGSDTMVLSIIDISDLSSPVLAGQYREAMFEVFPPGAIPDCGVAVSGKTAFVTTFRRLSAINVSNPASPVLVGTYPLRGTGGGIRLDGNLAYIADGSSRIPVIDVFKPSDMKLVRTYTTVGACQMALPVVWPERQGDYLYSAEGYGGFSVIDLAKIGTGIESAVPSKNAMICLYPNPFNLSTNIEYSLGGAKAGRVSLDIYDIHGKLVRRLAQGSVSGRTVSVTWDGKDAAGRIVCPAAYFCRLIVDGKPRATRKMLLIR
jgi:hypothetical protein